MYLFYFFYIHWPNMESRTPLGQLEFLEMFILHKYLIYNWYESWWTWKKKLRHHKFCGPRLGPCLPWPKTDPANYYSSHDYESSMAHKTGNPQWSNPSCHVYYLTRLTFKCVVLFVQCCLLMVSHRGTITMRFT
jgi:hypothetical protein